ncbi:hypothetical protein ACXAT3_000142 [Clostridium sporogenes]
MIKSTLEKMEYLKEEKLKHLVKFLESKEISMVSDDIATVDKHKLMETEYNIIVMGDAVANQTEEFIEDYKLEISKNGLLDWEEDFFSGAINLYYINGEQQLILDGVRYV